MSNQETAGRVHSPNSKDDQDRGDENPQAGLTAEINFGTQSTSDPSLMPYHTSTTSQEDGPSFDTLHALSCFELHSSMLSAGELYPRAESEIPCFKDVMHGLDVGQSSGAGTKHASESSQIQIGLECLEDGAKEGGECKKQKRKRSTEVHNLNERLRRQKLKEKMKALQELVPNCNKKDKSSTLDDAIKYIKTLEYQVQVMSMGAGHSMLQYSMPPMPQMPVIPPGLDPCARPVIGTADGIGMGMPCIPSPFNFVMSQFGLPNPPTTSGLPPLSWSQYPDNVLGSLAFTTYPINFDPSQGIPAIHNELCGVPRTTSVEQSIERGSIARALPSTVILTDQVVQGFGSSGSGSTQWPSSVATRSDDSVTAPPT